MLYGVYDKFPCYAQYGVGCVVGDDLSRHREADGEGYAFRVREKGAPYGLREVLFVERLVPQVPEAVSQLADGRLERAFDYAEVDNYYDVSELRSIIGNELDRRFDKAQAHIYQWAKTVFLVTTVSQTGTIDAVTSLVINCRMISDVIRCSGYRPSWGQLCKLYARILATSLFSYYLSDTLDKIEVDPEMLHLKALSNIPLMGTITKSLADGTFNTLLSLRIGHVSLACLRDGAAALSGKAGAKVRRQAMIDAVKSFLVLSKDTTIAGLSAMGEKITAWVNGEPAEPQAVPAQVPAESAS